MIHAWSTASCAIASGSDAADEQQIPFGNDSKKSNSNNNGNNKSKGNNKNGNDNGRAAVGLTTDG